LGVNWDLYHLQISEGDLTGHLIEGIDHVKYVQVADHPGRHEPGTGEIDYSYVLARLAGLGYEGPIGLECSPEHDADRAIARLEDLAARVAERRLANRRSVTGGEPGVP
jgi:hydroxypyruvate isomerase